MRMPLELKLCKQGTKVWQEDREEEEDQDLKMEDQTLIGCNKCLRVIQGEPNKGDHLKDHQDKGLHQDIQITEVHHQDKAEECHQEECHLEEGKEVHHRELKERATIYLVEILEHVSKIKNTHH